MPIAQLRSQRSQFYEVGAILGHADIEVKVGVRGYWKDDRWNNDYSEPDAWVEEWAYDGDKVWRQSELPEDVQQAAIDSALDKHNEWLNDYSDDAPEYD